MDKIVMIGGKGAAVVVAEQIFDAQQKGNDVEFIGFAFDDEAFYPEIAGFPVLCKTYEAYSKYERFSDVKFLFQIYRPDLLEERIRLRDSYGIPRERWANFVHPSAYVARSAKMGYGNVISANTVINSHAQLGDHNTIHSNVLVGHDTKIGNSNLLTAHTAIGSNNTIGDANFIGLNSAVNNYISIGNYNFIGMSSNVIKGLGDHMKVYGNPARPFESRIKPL